MFESPSGSLINPLFIRSVSKQQHFWSEKFYVTVVMQGGSSFEYERLSPDAADRLMTQVQGLVDECRSAANAYDEAYEGGRSEGYENGYNSGRNEGYTNGFQEAKDAFWSYEREEYRINDYNVGYEAGKRDADEQASSRWSDGYSCGRDEATDELGGTISELRAEVATLKRDNRRWRQRALQAESAMCDNGSTAGDVQEGKGRYGALRRSIARLFHPDNSAGSAFEKAIRQEIFKEIWAEIKQIEKTYAV